MKGFFAIDGLSGTGKFAQARLLVNYLRSLGVDAISTGPLGTPLGSEIKALRGDGALRVKEFYYNDKTTLLLHAAALSQWYNNLVVPATQAGKTVISAGSPYSILAHRYVVEKREAALADNLLSFACGAYLPQKTFLLLADYSELAERFQGQSNDEAVLFGLKGEGYAEQWLEGFRYAANMKKGEIIEVPAGKDVFEGQVHKQIVEAIHTLPEYTFAGS